MKVTFPHLGSTYIFCKAIAETAGIEYVLPRPTSNRTREIGYSTNESVCLPLKIILGNFVEALEDGADTIIMGLKKMNWCEHLEKTYKINSFICKKCEEACSAIRLYRDGNPVSLWNDRCGMYSTGEING